MKKCIGILLLVLALLGGAILGTWLFGNSFYAQTRKRLERPFTRSELIVCVEKDGDVLHSAYQALSEDGQTTITYTFEEFSLFEQKDGVYVAPSSRKETAQGSVLIENGQVRTAQGKTPPLSVGLITFADVSFQKQYFENATVTESTFEADVIDAQALPWLPDGCRSVHLKLSFDQTHVQAVHLTFVTAQGSNADLQFSFTY